MTKENFQFVVSLHLARRSVFNFFSARSCDVQHGLVTPVDARSVSQLITMVCMTMLVGVLRRVG